MKYFDYLSTIDEATLMALKKRNFYNKDIHLHEDTSTVNATFFKNIGAQNRMARNVFILKTEAEVKLCSKMDGNEKLSFISVEKHPVYFCLNINHPLMMFLWLIPLIMV